MRVGRLLAAESLRTLYGGRRYSPKTEKIPVSTRGREKMEGMQVAKPRAVTVDLLRPRNSSYADVVIIPQQGPNAREPPVEHGRVWYCA